MKKLIAVLLCCATVFCFAACGQKDEPDATTTKTPTTQEATTEQTQDTQDTIPETSVETTEATTPEPTTPSIKNMSAKEQFDTLTRVVGLSVFDAVAALGLKENELTEVETCYFALPIKPKLNGTKFRVLLGLNEETAKVHEVLYQAEFPFQPLEVAQAALKTVETLDQWAGAGKQLEADGSFSLRDAKDVDISAGLSLDEFAYSMLSWDYSKMATKTQKQYIKECQKTQAWKDAGFNKGVFGLFLEVSRARQTEGDQVVSDTCTIAFSVGVIASP